MRPWKSFVVLLAIAMLVALVGVVPAGARPAVNGKVCIVNAVGGSDDPFNASAAQGARSARFWLRVDVVTLDADSEVEVDANIDSFVTGGDCDLIVGIGFSVAARMEPFVADNPGQKFSVIDSSFGGIYPNAAEVLFRVDQASFLAGYVAAAVSDTGKVGVFGGLPIPPVTAFMDGYALGVEWFNQEYGEDVEVLGWDPDTQTGLFAGTFGDRVVGQALASDLYDQGADTVFPVAGVTSLGALDEAIERKTAGDDVRVIGVDYDWSRVLGDPDRVILTSVIKNAGVAVFNQAKALVRDTWSGGEVVEDLASWGVNIAPFRKLRRIIPRHIRWDLWGLRIGIIRGTIPTMPVGGLANPVQLVFSPAVVDPPAWQLLADTLHELTTLEFHATAPADWAEFVDMMCASPDTTLGASATVAYIVANDECGVAAGLRGTRFGSDRYWGQFLVPRAGPLGSIDDLADLTWAYPSEGSMSGYVVPLGMMTVDGIEAGASSAAGSHHAAVMAVYNGAADFGTTYFAPPLTPDGIDPWEEGDSPDVPDEFVDDCAPTPEGLYCDGYRVNDARAAVVGEAPDIVQQVRILGITPAIPNDGLSFGPDLPSDVRLAIETALIEMADPGSPYHSAFEDSLGALYGWQGVVLDDDGDYDELRVLLDAIGFGIDDI